MYFFFILHQPNINKIIYNVSDLILIIYLGSVGSLLENVENNFFYITFYLYMTKVWKLSNLKNKILIFYNFLVKI